MQRSEYRKTFAISQSGIKCFKTKHLREFKKIYIDQNEKEEDEDKYIFGSLTDTLAFEPELLDERFYITAEEVEIPGDKVKLILDKTYRRAIEIIDNKTKLNESGNLPELLPIPHIGDLVSFTDIILECAREIKYGGTTWTSTRILDTVVKDGLSYFKMLSKCNDRCVITPSDNADAIAVVEALRTNEKTKAYFVEQEGETLLFQKEIFVEYTTNNRYKLPLKGALDIIRLDHYAGTAQVADLKTVYKLSEFPRQAKSYDYVTQASFYKFLLYSFLQSYMKGKYKDYVILDPVNCAIDREYKEPYVFKYKPEDLHIVEWGSTEHFVTGWRSVLDNIGWHIDKNIWDTPRELYESGAITLNIFK